MTILPLLAALTALAAPAPAQPAAGIALGSPRAERVEVAPNLLPNFGFEEMGANGYPAGWEFAKNNTDASCVVDTKVAHSGKVSLRIHSTTPFAPHVYGMLMHPAPIRLPLGKPCVLSMWVRMDGPGNVGLMTGGAWQVRAYPTPSPGQWRRIWAGFTPGESDVDCIVRVSVEGPTQVAWIDDLKLEVGSVPSPVTPVGADASPASLDAAIPSTEIEGDGAFSLSYLLWTPRPLAASARFTIPGSPDLVAPITTEAGFWRISLDGTARGATDEVRQALLRLDVAGSATLSAKAAVRFLSPANALRRIAAIEARLPAFRKQVADWRKRGIDVSYADATLMTLEDFTGYAAEDARRREVVRSLQQVGDMEEQVGRLAAALRNPASQHIVPRWTGNARPAIINGSFVSSARLPNGKVVEQPIFFNGYGHFARVIHDLAKWKRYGTNIIQVEFGPNSIFPAPDKVDLKAAHAMKGLLDAAQKEGVAVCLLISPHYMPDWAFTKWPELRKRREGFIPYCTHLPEGRDLLVRFIKAALPELVHHPALQSICLSNEPVNTEEPCEPGKAMWRDWLRKRHGSIQALNQAWGTTLGSFGEATMPNPFGPRPAMPVWYDYVRYSQAGFSGWHRMMADAIHELAPDLPVHAKAMTWTMLNDTDIARPYGVEATQFADFSQVNGNDAVNWYSFGNGEWAQGWLQNAMGHDLQRSVLNAPVFNSENHIITDRNTAYVPAAHVRAALWQAAVHGQGATTIWVWERAFDPRSDFAGSIMHRPGCAEAVGVVNMDLNRSAAEMAAIQRAPADVAILQSVTSCVYDIGKHVDCMGKLYTALVFRGLKVRFVTEVQLERGVDPGAPVLFIPNAPHITAGALAGLRKYTGKIIFVGGADLLRTGEYGQALAPLTPAATVPFRYPNTGWQDLWKALLDHDAAWGLKPAIDLVDGGKPITGVEWRCGKVGNATIANLCNYRHTPARMAITREGKPVAAIDVLTGKPIRGAFSLAPLEVRLVRVGGDAGAKGGKP